MSWVGRIVEQREARCRDHLTDPVREEGPPANDGLAAQGAADDREQRGRGARIEDRGALEGLRLHRAQHARRATNRVGGGLFDVELTGSAPGREPPSRLVVAAVIGDRFDGHVGAGARVGRTDAGRRGDGRFGDVVRVVRRVDLTDARVAAAHQALEFDRHRDLLIERRTRDRVVGQGQRRGPHAVGTREGDELVFGREGHVVARLAQRVDDRLVVE